MTENDENTVFVGRKPTMNYVLAAVTQFNAGSDLVIIKARGKSISKAVDVAEIIRHRFVPDAEPERIEISTEELTNEEGKTTNVSSIEIFLRKTEE
ncbi:MAG: DNA-binding protein Alba [Thermoplasmata archaeon]|nr:DNA-binding protein Alba [Thermoplasmata archaeon]